jgi:hypothetical protein
MYPPTVFPQPISSFPEPIPVPTADPDIGTQWCVEFNQDYLPAVLGALLPLTFQATWDAATPDDNLLAQNRAMSLIYLFQKGNCMSGVMLAQCDPPECGIKFSTDGGATWTCADLSGCIADIVGIGITNAIDDGLLQKAGGQPSPAEPPAQSQCKTYHVLLNANDKWHCPSPVKNGDTVRVFNANGGWNDGDVYWFCPDGSSYLLGSCQGTPGQHHDGDPLNPGAFHMAVVGETLVDATWFDPMTLYTFAGLSADQDFILQANDGTLTDDCGQIEFDVEICTGGWTHVFDFTADGGGFYPYFASGQSRAEYHAGLGWTSYQISYLAQLLYIVQNVAGMVTHVQIRLSEAMTGGRHLFQIGNGFPGSTFIETSGDQATFDADVNITFAHNDDFCIGFDNYPGSVPYLIGITVSGTGQDIFTT